MSVAYDMARWLTWISIKYLVYIIFFMKIAIPRSSFVQISHSFRISVIASQLMYTKCLRYASHTSVR